MTAGRLAAVRRLASGDPAAGVADGVQAWAQLSQRLAQIVGELTVHMLLARSAVLTSARFPWLASAIPSIASTDWWVALRGLMRHQDPHTSSEVLVELLSRFIDHCERLIGDAVLAHLLHAQWPELFPLPNQGSP